MKGKGFVALRITGQDLNFEKITQALSKQPSFIYKKGDCYTPKYGNKKPIIYKEDCWIIEVEKCEDETIDNAVFAFITEFKNSKEYLNKIASYADLTLWVSLYPNDEQSNIHLENETLKLLADMGLCVDFDIMCLKDLYNGNYNN